MYVRLIKIAKNYMQSFRGLLRLLSAQAALFNMIEEQAVM